jgi:hypothetical protein
VLSKGDPVPKLSDFCAVLFHFPAGRIKHLLFENITDSLEGSIDMEAANSKPKMFYCFSMAFLLIYGNVE